MAVIAPFKAVRPARDKVHLVATRPIYSYKKNVLKAKLEDNPFTFLHIINPEFGNDVKTKPNSTERFQQVRKRFDEFVENGILIQDETPRIYIYRQTKNGHPFTGIIAGASIDEYKSEKIKKHEATITSRETMFTNYLEVVGFNAEPVLLSYKGSEKLEQLLFQFTEVRPEYEFTTTDRIKHELWVLTENDTILIKNAFDSIEATYIADGHHRSASSVRLFDELEKRNGNVNESAKYFLSFFVDENKLKILEFNRVVKTLNGYQTESFLHALKAQGTVTLLAGACHPSQNHQIHIYLNKKWFLFVPFDFLIEEEHPVKSLDSDLLTELILSPILGIEDLKASDQIEFVPGSETLETMEQKVNSGKFQVGFVLFPATIEQIKRVADQGMNMPPKSTWVEPKLRSGLTIYTINQ